VQYRESIVRYAFWPERKSPTPLLCICAIIIFCNLKATSTLNESFHSIVTYILRTSRAA
jgi:hypothetical protein